MRRAAICILLLGCLTLSACGAYLPQTDFLHPVDTSRSDNRDFDEFVRLIADHVACEIGNAADSLYVDDPTHPHHMLIDWAAKVELDLNAMETGDLNPGLNEFTKTMSFLLGVNGKLETQGVNNASITYYLPFDQIMSKGLHGKDTPWPLSCDQPTDSIKEPIQGNLGIQSILESGIKLYDVKGFIGE